MVTEKRAPTKTVTLEREILKRWKLQNFVVGCGERRRGKKKHNDFWALHLGSQQIMMSFTRTENMRMRGRNTGVGRIKSPLVGILSLRCLHISKYYYHVSQ